MIDVLAVYLMIGALIWLVLDGLGIIENSFAAGKSTTQMAAATVAMVVAWPLFVARFAWRMRRAYR